MKKLPQEIENLIKTATTAKNILDSYGHVFTPELKKALEAVEQYKKNLEKEWDSQQAFF